MLIEIAKYKGLVYLEKIDFLCDLEARTCDGATNEGYKSFYDYGNFTLEGAKHFGKRIHETNWFEID